MKHHSEPPYHHQLLYQRIPPALICAARRLQRDVRALPSDRSARHFLDTADARPPNRSVSATRQVSAAALGSARTTPVNRPLGPSPLGLRWTVVRLLCRHLWFHPLQSSRRSQQNLVCSVGLFRSRLSGPSLPALRRTRALPNFRLRHWTESRNTCTRNVIRRITAKPGEPTMRTW